MKSAAQHIQEALEQQREDDLFALDCEEALRDFYQKTGWGPGPR